MVQISGTHGIQASPAAFIQKMERGAHPKSTEDNRFNQAKAVAETYQNQKVNEIERHTEALSINYAREVVEAQRKMKVEQVDPQRNPVAVQTQKGLTVNYLV